MRHPGFEFSSLWNELNKDTRIYETIPPFCLFSWKVFLHFVKHKMLTISNESKKILVVLKFFEIFKITILNILYLNILKHIIMNNFCH